MIICFYQDSNKKKIKKFFFFKNRIENKKTKNLTPGELKRLSIAEEIVAGPSLLLLDEPTSNVNTQDEAVLLSTFRELVNSDRTVVATMNNPSPDVFKLFDSLILLSKGRIIYYGSIQRAAQFFITSPFQFDISSYSNQVEYLTDISGCFLKNNKVFCFFFE
jgi:ABC-type multidrug transport system ATPase subunit